MIHLQAEGDAQTRTAEAAAHIDDAKDKALEVLDHTKDKLADAAEKAKDMLHQK